MSTPIQIHFATVTGNAESLAGQAVKRFKKLNLPVVESNLAKVAPASLRDAGFALFIVSTWGDGDAPDDALNFWNALDAPGAPAMPGLRYAVFGLGDRSYPEFNAFARKLDERLAALGARRLESRFEADTDYEDDFEAWIERMQRILAVLWCAPVAA